MTGCTGDCLACGKCGHFPILEDFRTYRPIVEPRDGYGVAVDMGTTSVVMALADLTTGAILARHSFLNPQRSFGPDVMSRISAANDGHLDALRRALAESVAAGCLALLSSRGVRPEKLAEISVAGNTVTTYLLLGLPCESLGAFPYKPAFELDETYDGASVFGASALRCSVRVAPWLAAFAGGDVTAGLLHLLDGGRTRFMLADLGTNGEMALFDRGKTTVASAAAGPVFEGGRRGGGASGVIAELAELVRDGSVDKSGLLSDGAPEVFTQREIRDLQLAKSAIRTGLELLPAEAGLGWGNLEAVYLAGGIGQAMDVGDATAVGLLPPGIGGKTLGVGNASLGGAVRMLLSPGDASARVRALRANVVELNLAAHPRFGDCFMTYIDF